MSGRIYKCRNVMINRRELLGAFTTCRLCLGKVLQVMFAHASKSNHRQISLTYRRTVSKVHSIVLSIVVS